MSNSNDERKTEKVCFLSQVRSLANCTSAHCATRDEIAKDFLKFDRELARLFSNVAKAEDELIAYCKTRLEKIGGNGQ